MKLTSCGNLLSEYSNLGMDEVAVEAANRLSKDVFVAFKGKYETSWIEGKKAVNMQIDISDGPKKGMYKLIWTDGKTPVYHGIGFLVDEVLIGSYMDYDTYQDLIKRKD